MPELIMAHAQGVRDRDHVEEVFSHVITSTPHFWRLHFTVAQEAWHLAFAAYCSPGQVVTTEDTLGNHFTFRRMTAFGFRRTEWAVNGRTIHGTDASLSAPYLHPLED